jgi:hypothetical protein
MLFIFNDWTKKRYKTTGYYNTQVESTLLWKDLILAILCLLINKQEPLLSPKGKSGIAFQPAEVYPWKNKI